MAASVEVLARLERRLASLKTARPDQAETIDLHAELMRASLHAARPPRAQPFALPREQLVWRLEHGVPLLHDQPAQVDVHFAADLLSRLANVLQDHQEPSLQPRLDALVAAAISGRLDPARLFGEAFVQHREHLDELALAAGVDAELLGTLSARAVAPLLQAYAERLRPIFEQVEELSPSGSRWHQAYCLICGAWPLLAEQPVGELARFLRCAACGSAWHTRPTGCAYCGNPDPASLRTLRVDGEPRVRVDACERCHQYLKVFDTFDPAPAEVLALEDAMTQPLDHAAIEYGLHRPAGTGYTIELAVPEDEWLEELA